MKNIALFCFDCLRADEFPLFWETLCAESDAANQMSSYQFDKHFSTSPWTYPASNSMLTGLYPQNHGAVQSGSYRHSVREPWPNPALDSMPNGFSLLSQRGYYTIGISAIYWALNEYCDYSTADCIIRSEKQNLDYKNAPADWVVETAKRRITDAEAKPWFLFCHLSDLHRPYDLEIAKRFSDVTDKFLPGVEAWGVEEELKNSDQPAEFKRQKLELYRGLVRYSATRLALFFEYLESIDQLENTTVILTADHGEEFWEHWNIEVLRYNCGYRSQKKWLLGTGHGHTMFDELLHIPLLVINPPAKIPAHKTSSLTSHVDILPTLLEIANTKKEVDVDGLSLFSSNIHKTIWSEAILYGYEKKALIRPEAKTIFAPYEGFVDQYDRTDFKEVSPKSETVDNVVEVNDLIKSYCERYDAKPLLFDIESK